MLFSLVGDDGGMGTKGDFSCDPPQEGHSAIRVVLQGGPAGLPSEMSLHPDVLADGKVKVPHYGGYEHFELASENWPEINGPPIFRWTTRTKVAE